MKATLLTSAIALCALTAFAADQQAAAQQQQTAPAEQQAAPAEKAAPAVTSTAPSPNDSPLVAAAKRSGRLGKKPTTVITNDTLLKSGGHFTTTKSQDPLPEQKTAASAKEAASNAPITTEGKAAQPAPAAKKAESEKKEKAAKKSAAAHAAADYEGATTESVNDDPATQEAIMKGGVAPKPAEPAKPAAPRPPGE